MVRWIRVIRHSSNGLRAGTARSLLPTCALVVLAALSSASPAAAKMLTAANWDRSAQRLVVTAGVMAEAPPGGFAGGSPMTSQATSQALAALSTHLGVPAATASTTSTSRVSVIRFDALLVRQLGLADVAAHVQQATVAAGLQPPSYFGSEVVARYLGLRYDHPAGEDSLELYPWDPITRAEAAHSLAVVLQSEGWAVEGARQTLSAFALPNLNPNQIEVLRIAVAKIGMPYVWGGTTDDTADGLEHGGYDCSGFAWRVYKVSGLAWGAQILGRTAAEQGGEVPRSARIRPAAVAPGDLLFFGSAHFSSKATEADITHEGIALSSEWAIHASDQGVNVLPLKSGWLAQQLAWARRVL
jgi:cell wall-associated NlpC family hydrolase